METDNFYLYDDYDEEERLSFIASEMESLKQMASLYDGEEFAISRDEN